MTYFVRGNSQDVGMSDFFLNQTAYTYTLLLGRHDLCLEITLSHFSGMLNYNYDKMQTLTKKISYHSFRNAIIWRVFTLHYL